MSVKLNISNTEAEVLTQLANYFMQVGTEAIEAKGRFSVSLSGGSSPKKLYELLASAEYKDMIDWTKVDFFFGDERNVPQDDKDSNYLMVKTALFDPLNIPHENIFAVNTSSGPDGAAKEYTIAILNYFKGEEQIFDLVLLGLGDNSHTASLFPYTAVLEDRTASVKEVYLEDQQVFRITMTAPLINLAKHIAFLVYGQGKALAVRHVLEDAQDIPEFPAQLIRRDGDVVWFLDTAAASELAEK
ncbi:6-phosphogluconolactonase [Mucilaginibacter myungsuensis]|uniref:6-phosphogluconolactonase n=1 Tax=Mucilaginibacter myungsuensis TaxID=649104 RepID=A0A929KVI2_9SPHI|nr:6-phosphogluconolactonase [Mucilaginibacter myungsuensis]MBE9661917.1 6-phosphogluconolactonase [Mucilaginibacter myungsuensis]MDN3599649.1 6-phosphogluconolactonase [Mucilaginibacter myungsuensis]